MYTMKENMRLISTEIMKRPVPRTSDDDDDEFYNHLMQQLDNYNEDEEEEISSEETETDTSETPGETESDLIRKLDLIELIAFGPVTVKDTTYMPIEYKEYTNHIYIKYNIVSGFNTDDIFEEEVSIPKTENQRFYEYECNGQTLVWDNIMMRHRIAPDVKDEDWQEINPWVSVAPGEALRVEKNYAEHNLSADCLNYGAPSDNYYIWDMYRKAHLPVVFELRSLFHKDTYDELGILNVTPELRTLYYDLRCFCSDYCEAKNIGDPLQKYINGDTIYYENGPIDGYVGEYELYTWQDDEMVKRVMNLQKSKLWTPAE